MYFSQEDILQFKEGWILMNHQYEQLKFSWSWAQFQTEKGKEYALHGFSRRISTLKRCIDNIFAIFPPEKREKLNSEEMKDVEINLQAFFLNIFGCLDNLIWVWVFEKNVTDKKGNFLGSVDRNRALTYRHKVAYPDLSKQNVDQFVYNSLPDSLQEEVAKTQTWFQALKIFRDSLAHRVPLYVPKVHTPETQERERQLMAERNFLYQEIESLNAAWRETCSQNLFSGAIGKEAIEAHNLLLDPKLDRLEQMRSELDTTANNGYAMFASYNEFSRGIQFHDQLFSSFATIHLLATNFLKEMA